MNVTCKLQSRTHVSLFRVSHTVGAVTVDSIVLTLLTRPQCAERAQGVQAVRKEGVVIYGNLRSDGETLLNIIQPRDGCERFVFVYPNAACR
jgi:hypothetical protein